MDHPGYLDNILVFLTAAVIVVFAFRRVRASPVLGYLVSGMLLGPYMTGLVDDVTQTQYLGELGVVFLLFTIGLELPAQRLLAMGRFVFGLGLAQVVSTAIIISAITYLFFDFSMEASILVGSALALSSTAVVLQVLNERKELAATYGRISFSILLLQDLAVVLILVLSTSLIDNTTPIFWELGFSVVKGVTTLSLIIVLGRIVFRPLYRLMAATDNRELFMATTFLLVLGASYFTESVGLSLELGAFLAGMLLAETEYRHQIEADIEPFKGLLLGVFFMSVGMNIDLHALWNSWDAVFGVVMGMLVIKALIIFILCMAFHLKPGTAIRVSLILAGGGEFVFVIFSPSVVERLLPINSANILFVAVSVSMALTPVLAVLGKKLANLWFKVEGDTSLETASEEVGELKNHIIIAGYGHVGQLVAEVLAEKYIPFVAIDNDMRRVTEGRNNGLPVFYGDARRLEVMRALGAEHARAIVVTLSQMTASVKTVMTLRRYFPDLPACVRVRDSKHQERLINSGAHLVVPETLEPSLQLATAVLHRIGMPVDEITTIVEAHRKKHMTFGELEEES